MFHQVLLFLPRVIFYCWLEVEAEIYSVTYSSMGGNTNSAVGIENIKNRPSAMAVTTQAVRPLPPCKKVKQFNDIKKHQLTFLTCNGWIFFFTKHCNFFSEYGANVNAEQHNDCVLNGSIVKVTEYGLYRRVGRCQRCPIMQPDNRNLI